MLDFLFPIVARYKIQLLHHYTTSTEVRRQIKEREVMRFLILFPVFIIGLFLTYAIFWAGAGIIFGNFFLKFFGI